MKRTHICALVLILAMLLSFAACGGGTATPTEPAASAPTQTTAEPEPTPAEPAAQEAPPAAPETQSAPQDDAIRVNTVDEFLESIAPGAVIELAPGSYNLSAYLGGAAGGISDYVGRSFCADGWQTEINRVDGLTIRGADGGRVEVVTEPRHADVLFFNACSDITIENITFGHTVEQGSCEGSVLEFDSCRGVTLNGLDLYGCGTYGVAAKHTTGIELNDSVIRDCSYGIISLNVCGDVTAKNCTFRNNGGYDLVSLANSFARFDGCAFTENEGDEFLHASAWYGDDSGARFDRCTFGRWESERLDKELRDHGNYLLGSDCRFDAEVGRRVVRASSVEELIEGIAPNTEILLAPGRYNLSEGLAKLLEQKGEDFARDLAFVSVNDEYDGPELIVTGVSGFAIASESGSAVDTEIVTEPRHADVIRFEDCSGVGVMDLTMGHTEAGECSGDVLKFTGCGGVALCGLDLYGCGVYGVGANECGRLSCFDSTIRDCRYGALELYGAQERQMFLNCAMTGSGGGGSFYADEGSNGKFYFFRCVFGERESNVFAFDDTITAEDCSWSEITEYPDYAPDFDESELAALDTSRVKTAPFDQQVLADVHVFLCYEIVNRQSGDVTFVSPSAMKLLAFEKDGTGYLLDSDGTQYAYKFAMDSNYSCVLSFDDGREASVGLCADQGGALPGSQEGQLWLQMYWGDEVLWFY
ncbi:MAG: right-handed parallel beta-helix repeat-containing protein [Ruminococcaceae bacterium]|nr:right-handed parallel beta-helix repeat-containing protein [Oscillospiraceae bacterium]